MRKSRPRTGPKGPGPLSEEKEARLREIASRRGVKPPTPGDRLDRKYNVTVPTPTSSPQTLYQFLVTVFGTPKLEVFERGLYILLGGVLLVFIVGGLAISSEAFLKASGKPVPDQLDDVLSSVQVVFTPIGLAFLALSSVLGVYKRSQLNSGVTAYSELRKDGRKNTDDK